ncbi:MAG: sodium:calcium symporter [Gemmatimonadetes bacterium]|nr:sodium:calcium symporter [Gemmatimonadota bacterium]
MAGNAVGLGNFLRFPVQAANNGGGTFMIPYFISLLLLGIPLMWMEWGIGRYGGRYGHGTIPGMFDRMWRHPVAKYVGVLGVIMPLVVFVYYTVIVGWILGFTFFSITGSYFGLSTEEVAAFLYSFQNIHDSSVHGGWVGFLFYGLTLAFITWILARGISGGIEKLALYGMPLLFLFAFILLIRVLTLPPAEGSPGQGLAFIWTPQWSALGDAGVWVAAAGQIFFTLSLGMGSIHTYASYLSRKDDITLTGLSTAATNEFAEVALGGTIAIPAAVTFFGVTGAMAIASRGSFDFGIIAMAIVFQGLPGPQILGQIAGFMWYALLFIAGITSSVALASPAMAFLQEEFGLPRKKVALGLGLTALALGLAVVWWYRMGWLTEWDDWAGTFGLVVFAFIEVWIIRLAFGVDRFWEDIHEGADLRIPLFFKFVMKWVAPLFLTGLLIWYGLTAMRPAFLMEGVPAEQLAWRWAARLTMVAMLLAGILLIRAAWRRRAEHAPVEATTPAQVAR